jgi:hypothetical protein
MLGDEEIQIIRFEPRRHTRWALICPVIDCLGDIAGSVELMFRQLGVYAAQHGLQVDYDNKFKEVTK